jgi:hypothetical protein
VYCADRVIHILNPRAKITGFRIFDLSGRCLKSGTLYDNSRFAIPSPIPSGILIVQLIQDEKTESHKIVIL